MKIRSSSMNSTSVSSSSHSSILTHSFPASETSNSPSPSSSPPNSMTRCKGLDLLVMAVHYVSRSTVGIPFAQKRVIRRRKRALRFNNLIVTGIFGNDEEEEEGREGKEEEETKGCISKPKRQKRAMAVPSKYQDSVLQPWKRQSRRRHQSTEIGSGSGSPNLCREDLANSPMEYILMDPLLSWHMILAQSWTAPQSN